MTTLAPPGTWSQMVASACASDRPAVISTEDTCSGRELMDRASGCADWLDAMGAEAGSTVPALLSANAAALALVIAGAGSGRPIAPLGARLTARELARCVEPLGSSLLVTAPAFVGLASEVAAATGCRVGVLAEVAPSSRALDVQTVPDAIAFVLHTSGTTGSPKAIPCRQDRLAERVRVNASALSMRAESVFASPSPFHHIAVLGNHAVALAIGAAVAPMPRFDVAEWRALARAQTTHVLLVPTVIEMLLEADALDALPTLQVLQYGASPIEPETLRRVLDVLPSVKPVQMFGQTEGSPITCLTPDDHRRALDGEPHLLRSVGRAAPGAEVRIDEPDDAGIGEICARAPHFFGADPDGWVRTGDLGHLDDLGYLFLAGRKADMVIRGGENVYPVEVEQVLLEHPAVRDVAVVGRPDALLGEVLKAYVVPADDSSLPSADELHAFARKSLAGFKVPAAWEFIDELPRNAAGKVLRRELVERPVD